MRLTTKGRYAVTAMLDLAIHDDRDPVALADIAEGDTIIKYGHDIGRAVAGIEKGGHAHVQNVKTKKW